MVKRKSPKTHKRVIKRRSKIAKKRKGTSYKTITVKSRKRRKKR